MTKELLQQCLRALESCTPGDYSTGHVIDPYFDESLVADAYNAVKQAIEREKAKPRNEAEVINDLTPTRRSCVTCKFEHYDNIEAPCLPCHFYSNWEQKP